MFVRGTERDQVAPWHSVFELHQLNDGELTFVLTSGGHNPVIVSEPGHSNRHFRIRVRNAGGRAMTPDEWARNTSPKEGSWWLAWGQWLAEHSPAPSGGPTPMGAPGFAPICDASSPYVYEMWSPISSLRRHRRHSWRLLARIRHMQDFQAFLHSLTQ